MASPSTVPRRTGPCPASRPPPRSRRGQATTPRQPRAAPGRARHPTAAGGGRRRRRAPSPCRGSGQSRAGRPRGRSSLRAPLGGGCKQRSVGCAVARDPRVGVARSTRAAAGGTIRDRRPPPQRPAGGRRRTRRRARRRCGGVRTRYPQPVHRVDAVREELEEPLQPGGSRGTAGAPVGGPTAGAQPAGAVGRRGRLGPWTAEPAPRAGATRPGTPWRSGPPAPTCPRRATPAEPLQHLVDIGPHVGHCAADQRYRRLKTLARASGSRISP